MSARWIAALESKRNKRVLRLVYSGRNLQDGEWVAKANLVRQLQKDAAAAGHEYLVERIDSKTEAVVSSRNRIWKQAGVQNILKAKATEAKATEAKATEAQPQNDVAELKELILALAEKIDRLS